MLSNTWAVRFFLAIVILWYFSPLSTAKNLIFILPLQEKKMNEFLWSARKSPERIEERIINLEAAWLQGTKD